MANEGEWDGIRVMSKPGYDKMMDSAIKRKDAATGSITCFSQGGINYFE